MAYTLLIRISRDGKSGFRLKAMAIDWARTFHRGQRFDDPPSVANA
jgi:hypothetical protein